MVVLLELFAVLSAAQAYLRGLLTSHPTSSLPAQAPAPLLGWGRFDSATCPSLFPLPALDAPPVNNLYFLLNCPRCETRSTLSKYCSLRPPGLQTRGEAQMLLASLLLEMPNLRTRLCVARAQNAGNRTVIITWGRHGNYISQHVPAMLSASPPPPRDLIDDDDDEILHWPLDDTSC